MANNANEPLRVTSVKEWEEKYKGVNVTLPFSGNVVKVRPVTAHDVIFEGNIPDTLTPIVARLDGVGGSDSPEDNISAIRDLMPLINHILTVAILEPTFVTGEPGKGELNVSVIPARDRVQLFHYLNGDARALQPFREEPELDVATVPPEQNVGGSP